MTLAAMILAALAGNAVSSTGRVEEQTHLFILSGQSNMAGLKPERTFTPAVEKGLAGQRVLVVKDAHGGQPIRRWYKKWKPGEDKVSGKAPPGDLYDRLWKKVSKAIGDHEPTSVTFVWMQGERDAAEGHGDVYQQSLAGLIIQLRADLKKHGHYAGRLHSVVGRLSDHENKKYVDWSKVRAAQVALATKERDVDWIDTDALNGAKNGLHFTKEGYDKLGELFAESALKWIRATRKDRSSAPAGDGA